MADLRHDTDATPAIGRGFFDAKITMFGFGPGAGKPAFAVMRVSHPLLKLADGTPAFDLVFNAEQCRIYAAGLLQIAQVIEPQVVGKPVLA